MPEDRTLARSQPTPDAPISPLVAALVLLAIFSVVGLLAAAFHGKELPPSDAALITCHDLANVPQGIDSPEYRECLREERGKSGWDLFRPWFSRGLLVASVVFMVVWLFQFLFRRPSPGYNS